MPHDEILQKELFKLIKNQLKNNDPPETKIVYDKLKAQGYSELQTMQMIGLCLSIEIYGALKSGQPYNNDRYVNNLNNLPEDPIEKT